MYIFHISFTTCPEHTRTTRSNDDHLRDGVLIKANRDCCKTFKKLYYFIMVNRKKAKVVIFKNNQFHSYLIYDIIYL